MKASMGKANKWRVGIVGGIGALGAADLYYKITRALAVNRKADAYELLLEHRSFHGYDVPSADSSSLAGRKLYVYDMIKQFEARHVDLVLLPCFVSHTFLDEIQAEPGPPVVNIMEALVAHTEGLPPGAIGVLTSDLVHRHGLFDKWFAAQRRPVLYPDADVQRSCVMESIYGRNGIKAGAINGDATQLLHRASLHLLDKGASIIVPGSTEIAVVADKLRDLGIPIVDTNTVYAEYALEHGAAQRPRQFRVGVVGGVGPAATVDFMSKIVQSTEARRDQDHIKLIVEHNPQIPDRTANLVGDGEDPTVALYSACKRLEANDADLIAIPCNTAHAYVDRIQSYLSVPILNMLHEAISHVSQHLPGTRTVGLLATSGTVASGVYHAAARDAAFDLIVPDEEHQAAVMRAIYGERGVKAGFRDGECHDDLMRALTHLVARGAEVVLLACTELPLIIPATPALDVGGKRIAVLDPTEILARRCVQLSKSGAQAARPATG